MLLIFAYTHWMGYELVTEMKVFFFTSNSVNRSSLGIPMNRREIWQKKVRRMSTISSLGNCVRLMAYITTFVSLSNAFSHQQEFITLFKYHWTSHDTLTCYLLSHCQFQQPVYLSTSSVLKRLHCDYSAWFVTLSVLELVQLADMFRFVVVYWVKGVNWIENITDINRSELLSWYDKLPFVSQVLSAGIYIQISFELSGSLCRSSHRLVYSSRSTRCKETEGSL
jgi:hypothetical protein